MALRGFIVAVAIGCGCAFLSLAGAGQPVADTQAAKDAVSKELDDLHDAAAKADEARYFAHFTKDAVFLGTDATERWTTTEFHAWAKPYFAKGTAWTYTSRRREVFISQAGDAAWFDEDLENAKLGACRGSGVLVKEGGRWLVAQYNLSLPVPNELALKVVDMIKSPDKKPGDKSNDKAGDRPGEKNGK